MLHLGRCLRRFCWHLHCFLLGKRPFQRPRRSTVTCKDQTGKRIVTKSRTVERGWKVEGFLVGDFHDNRDNLPTNQQTWWWLKNFQDRASLLAEGSRLIPIRKLARKCLKDAYHYYETITNYGTIMETPSNSYITCILFHNSSRFGWNVL